MLAWDTLAVLMAGYVASAADCTLVELRRHLAACHIQSSGSDPLLRSELRNLQQLTVP